MPRVTPTVVIIAILVLTSVPVEAVIANSVGAWSSSITINIRRRTISPDEGHVVTWPLWSWCW